MHQVDVSFRYENVERSIVEAVRKGVEGKDIGVAFSGGLDSGLVSAIAKEYARSVTLYTCGTTNAYDVVMARDLSEKLRLPWVHVQISKGNIEDNIRGLILASGTSDPFTVSYELPLFCVCKEANEDVVLTGQGSDEYFMGCAKFVGRSDEDYDILVKAGVERLLNVSVPCEIKIADHFGKTLIYPYLDEKVTSDVAALDPADLRPTDMDSRKSVLKDIAVDLGFPCVADRKKKSSQYGSGTTDLVRAIAKEKGKWYNEYVASVYDEVFCGASSNEGSMFINARVDPLVRAQADMIIRGHGVSPSDAVEMFYRKIIEDGDLRSVRKK